VVGGFTKSGPTQDNARKHASASAHANLHRPAIRCARSWRVGGTEACVSGSNREGDVARGSVATRARCDCWCVFECGRVRVCVRARVHVRVHARAHVRLCTYIRPSVRPRERQYCVVAHHLKSELARISRAIQITKRLRKQVRRRTTHRGNKHGTPSFEVTRGNCANG
jgi:hypothetical protein